MFLMKTQFPKKFHMSAYLIPVPLVGYGRSKVAGDDNISHFVSLDWSLLENCGVGQTHTLYHPWRGREDRGKGVN